MKTVAICSLVVAVGMAAPIAAQETLLRLDLVDPIPVSTTPSTDAVTAALEVDVGPVPALDTVVPLAVDVVLESALAACVEKPDNCDTSERGTTDVGGVIMYHCGDGIDNDGDGAVDTDDVDCIGVQGWSLSVRTDPCFNVESATVNGTAGGLSVVAPGLRDLEGSFAKTEVVDPGRNEGLEGVVSAVVLSFSNPIIMPQVSENSVLRINGVFNPGSGLAVGATSAPCGLAIIPSDQRGLVGAGEAVKTAVTIEGRTRAPAVQGLFYELTVTGTEPTPEPPPDPMPEPPPDPMPEPPPDPMPEPPPDPTPEPTPQPDDLEQAGFRVTVLEPSANEGEKRPPGSGSGVATWSIPVDPKGSGPVPMRVGITLINRVEPCFSEPDSCRGTENFRLVNEETFATTYGCSDGIDNDGNGLVDSDDPDCNGAQGWSISVATDDCFNIQDATTIGTWGDLSVRPPGVRDLAGSFARTEVVDPLVNDGQQGVASAIVLSFNNPIVLPQLEETLILILEGELDRTPITGPNVAGPLCDVEVVPPTEPGLTGAGEPVRSAVTVGGRTIRPNVCQAELQLVGAEGPPPLRPFVRGNSNDDSRVDVADPVYTVSALFRSGPGFPCEDAADANDDEKVDASDAVFTIAYLFGIPGGPPPPGPFPGCGEDATNAAGGLTCLGSQRCP